MFDTEKKSMTLLELKDYLDKMTETLSKEMLERVITNIESIQLIVEGNMAPKLLINMPQR